MGISGKPLLLNPGATVINTAQSLASGSFHSESGVFTEALS
jgi:hypothetical protein